MLQKKPSTKEFQDIIQKLESQLESKKQEVVFFQNAIAQFMDAQEEIETENLMLECDNEILREENEEYLAGGLYAELWDEHQALREENSTLRAQNNLLIAHSESFDGMSSVEISDRNKQLLRENQRLRDQNDMLLERITEMEDGHYQFREGVVPAISEEMGEKDGVILKANLELLRKNQALSQKNEDVCQENMALRAEHTELLQRIRQNASYSAKTNIDTTERPNFIRFILSLPARGLETAFSLEPIKGRVVGEDSGEYFRQFIPYILEEIRSSICAQKNIISKKNRPPFQIYHQSGRERIVEADDELDIDETGEQTISFWAYERDLPKLDHGFFNEAVLIVLSESKYQKGKSSDNKLEGILAIATTLPSYDDDENAQRKIKIKLILPKKDYQTHLQKLLREEDKLWLHWLCGLTPSERMFEVCVSMPGVDFQQQFIEANLLPWLDSSEESQAPILSGLNEIQNRVVRRLQNTASGLRLIIGPPGTGKTTTAIRFLAEYAKKNPTRRILVCAPSNQAVRVLLMQALPFLSASAVALTGIAKNIPEILQEIYVHKYAGNFFKLLIVYKKELKKNISKDLLDEINQHLIDLEKKVRASLSAPTEMFVKHHIKKSINTFLEDLSEKSRGFYRHYEESASINFNARAWGGTRAKEWQEKFSDDLEEIITCFQENSFYLESYRLQRSQVVFATLISSGRKWLSKQIDSFSTILLDEAAQALVPETLIPLRFKPSLYVQFGDPNQLPATITSQATRNKGYENSMMHWLIKEFDQPYEMLTIQYRMDPAICSWISRQYYENRLTTAPEVVRRESIFTKNRYLPEAFKRSSLFFNIRGEENRRGGSELTASCFNVIEAKRVIDVAYYLIMNCNFDPKQLGIITFYAEQVNVLLENLKKAIPDRNKHRDLEIKTVDGFQGGEKDIVLVSVVRTIESV